MKDDLGVSFYGWMPGTEKEGPKVSANPHWKSHVCWFVRCPEFHVCWLWKGSLGNRSRLVWLLSPYCTSHLLLSERFWLRRKAKENFPGVTLENLLASPPYGTVGLCHHGAISISGLHQSIPFIWGPCYSSVWKTDGTHFPRVLSLPGYRGGLGKGWQPSQCCSEVECWLMNHWSNS